MKVFVLLLLTMCIMSARPQSVTTCPQGPVPSKNCNNNNMPVCAVDSNSKV